VKLNLGLESRRVIYDGSHDVFFFFFSGTIDGKSSGPMLAPTLSLERMRSYGQGAVVDLISIE
jgi:hypothetical protein